MAKEGKKSKKVKEEKATEPEKSGKKDKAAKQEKPSKPQNGEVVMTKYSGSIALTKMVHAVMIKKNKKGKKIKCLVIPIEENFLTVGKDKEGNENGAFYMNISVITKTPQDEYGQNGFIGQNHDTETYKKARDKGKELPKLPILGNIKNWEDNGSSGERNDATGKAGDDMDENDDLPF